MPVAVCTIDGEEFPLSKRAMRELGDPMMLGFLKTIVGLQPNEPLAPELEQLTERGLHAVTALAVHRKYQAWSVERIQEFLDGASVTFDVEPGKSPA